MKDPEVEVVVPGRRFEVTGTKNLKLAESALVLALDDDNLDVLMSHKVKVGRVKDRHRFVITTEREPSDWIEYE